MLICNKRHRQRGWEVISSPPPYGLNTAIISAFQKRFLAIRLLFGLIPTSHYQASSHTWDYRLLAGISWVGLAEPIPRGVLEVSTCFMLKWNIDSGYH
jgi:hypothetical protein